jgi:hypothetical protein
MDDRPPEQDLTSAATPDESLLPQLMAILTARWREEGGRLSVGAPRKRLLEALRVDEPQLDALLDALAKRAEALGLELRDYRRAGDTWCCLTAVHGGPVELTDVDQGVLGLVIHLVLKSGRRRCAETEAIHEILVGREYLTDNQLQSVLRRLEYHGYIHRGRGTVTLDCRTTLEFDENAQKEIAEQAKLLIL